MPIRRWQVWSLDPQSGRWVVVDAARELEARDGAASRMKTARKYGVVGAAYVALPPGETPRVEHHDLAVTEEEVAEDPPATARISLTGTGTLPTPTGTGTFSAQYVDLLRGSPGSLNPNAIEPFEPDAFDGMVGRVIPLRRGSQVVRWARVTDAVVAPGGERVSLTLEPAAGPDEGD